MNDSTNHSPIDSFDVLVGIDWADRKHDVVVKDGSSVQHEVIEHTPAAIDEWIGRLRQGGRSIAVAVELSRGPLVNALMKHDVTIFPIPPARLAKYREAFSSSGAKGDPTDAALALDYLVKHGDQLRAWVPDDPKTREIALLTERRRSLIDMRTQMANMLRDAIKLYFPQLLDWFPEIHAPIACDFMLRWPSLLQLQRAQSNSIRKFFITHNSRHHERIERIVNEITAATALTNDTATISATTLMVRALARQLKSLGKSLADIDARIDELFNSHPDARLFASLPGAGAALAPRLLIAFGADRSRYDNASQLQVFSGTAPVTVSSGKARSVRRRFSAPKFLKQTFHEFAAHSRIRGRSLWACAYYEQCRERGMKHHAAVRALAYKWIRVLFACWKQSIPYDEARYLEALCRANSPLVPRINAMREQAAAA